MYKKRSSSSELFCNWINVAEKPLPKLAGVPCFQVLVRNSFFCLSPGLCPLWQCWDVALARRGCCWQWPLQFGCWSSQLCSVCSEPHLGCADPSRSPGDAPLPPLLTWDLWQGCISVLFGISPCSGLLFWDEEELLWLHGVLVLGIFNSQKGACSSGYAHFKMCIYEFKTTNIFLLGCFIFEYFFPNKPCNELILWLTHR